jgi:hypothetical protein
MRPNGWASLRNRRGRIGGLASLTERTKKRVDRMAHPLSRNSFHVKR